MPLAQDSAAHPQPTQRAPESPLVQKTAALSFGSPAVTVPHKRTSAAASLKGGAAVGGVSSFVVDHNNTNASSFAEYARHNQKLTSRTSFKDEPHLLDSLTARPMTLLASPSLQREHTAPCVNLHNDFVEEDNAGAEVSQ